MYTQNNSTVPHEENFFKELLKFTCIAVCIVLPIRLFIAQPFIVSGASMFPTFDSGDYLIVDEISYRFHTPERGDVVIFKYPKNPSKYFIKRVIALPGEKIDIDSNGVMITNTTYPEGFNLTEPYIDIISEANASTHITLEDDEYFVMGDNRFASSDSRIWGPLKKDFIVGKAFLRLLPIEKIDILPGTHMSASLENK